MIGLPPVSKEEGSSFRVFVQANQSALWEVSYFVIAVFLFAVKLPDPSRNEDPVGCFLHVFRSLGLLVYHSVLLLPSCLTRRSEGHYLCSGRRYQRFPARFTEAEFHTHGVLCNGADDLVN